MTNIRIYQLAKQLGKPSKLLVEELKQQGLPVKSYMSTVDDDTAQLILNLFEPKKEDTPSEAETGKAVAKEKKTPKASRRCTGTATKKAPVIKAKEVEAEDKEPPTEPKPKTAKKQRDAKRAKPSEEKVSAPAPEPQAAPVAAVLEEGAPDGVADEVLALTEAITVKELAENMQAKANDVIKTLMQMGIMCNINQVLDFNTAEKVAGEYGFQVTMEGIDTDEEVVIEDEEGLEPRPPVVTIMGHVDHGKTRLLDAIRETKVMEGEAGGITQHIGAYSVDAEKGKIAFLDTPGHEAFTAMRARGAQVTDIVVLVVAADDGVMPQTREAVAHAKSAEVPILVAINKIDKPNAQPERVKQQLTELGLLPEEWGGETIYCEVSAKERIGIDDLLEMILLQAEVLELKCNPNKLSRGTIIEAKLDKGRGPVFTVLVQDGTLSVGNPFVCGLEYGKVRAMFSDSGKRIQQAGPSVPVEVLGVSDVPKAGDLFQAVEEERKARQIGYLRQQQQREKDLAGSSRITLDDLYLRIQEGQIKELNVVLKTDVHGSLQAITESLEKLGTDDVKIKIIHGSVGAIREGDIGLASASQAVVIGFNARPTPQASEMAGHEGIDVRLYTVIYELVADVKAAMEGLLDPITKEVVLGQAEIRQVFNISRIGTVAGCYVIDGIVKRDSNIRVIRDNIVVYEGKVGSLKRFKDDVREVASGYECGTSVDGYNDIKLGDVLEYYEFHEVARK